jgi:hypothetical protein
LSGDTSGFCHSPGTAGRGKTTAGASTRHNRPVGQDGFELMLLMVAVSRSAALGDRFTNEACTNKFHATQLIFESLVSLLD